MSANGAKSCFVETGGDNDLLFPETDDYVQSDVSIKQRFIEPRSSFSVVLYSFFVSKFVLEWVLSVSIFVCVHIL